MMSNPRIGSRVKVRSTGMVGEIIAKAIMKGSKENIFLVAPADPDTKKDRSSSWVRYFDVEVIPKPRKRKEA